ncbi:diguanylate cyclase [Oceanimonas sp. NS1]|nr:diguanylate cyclase [Oceanimonas sp. NS1]
MYESLLCHESVILIVDHRVSDIQLLGDAAKGLGMLHFASNGVQALELARQVRPDVVLLDIEMSGMDGFQLCEALKSDASLANTAMIFVTAHHNTEHEVHALELGGVDFLTKPINVPVARARIRNHVRLQQMARALANQDALTGLPNRLLLQDRISQAIHKARRHNGRVALMTLDLDNFRKINDAEGLAVGDKLLQRVAGRLSECSRVEDTVSRSGSDEFIILLPEVGSAGAVGNFAQRLLNALSEPFVMDSGTYTLSVTIGISLYPDDNNDAESIFQHAETALYQAKAGGRNRYSFFRRK